MNDLKNLTSRNLSVDEQMALVDVSDALERGFGKGVRTLTVTAQKDDSDEVFGVMVRFQ